MEQDVSHQGSQSHPGSFPGLGCQGQVQNPRTQRNLESALPAAGFGSALCARSPLQAVISNIPVQSQHFLCAAAHVCPGKALTQHPGVLAQPSFPQESPGQVRPALLQGMGLMEAAFGCQGCAPGLCLLLAKAGSSCDQTHFTPAALHLPALVW